MTSPPLRACYGALLGAALLGTALPPPAAAAAADIVTLSNGEWRPYLSEHAPHFGVVSRIVSEAFALEGVTVRYVFRPWKRAYVEAVQGEVDGSVVWGPGPADAPRDKLFHLSDTVVEGRTVFFHLRSHAFQWNSYNDLLRVRVGGTAGYEYDFERLRQIQIDRAASDEGSFRKLLAGRFDIFPMDLYAGRAVLKEHFTPDQIALITSHPKAYSVTGYHLIMSNKLPKNKRYIALFNRGLKQLKDSGKYAYFLQELETGT